MVISIPAVKLVAQITASVGVSKVVHDVIRNNAIVVSTADAVKIWVGSLVIGSMTVDYTSKYINNTIDDIVQNLENRKNANSPN